MTVVLSKTQISAISELLIIYKQANDWLLAPDKVGINILPDLTAQGQRL